MLMVLLLIIGALMAGPMLQQYFLTDNFRLKVTEAMEEALDASVTISPIRRADDTLFSGHILIRPRNEGAYREAVLREVRLKLKPPGLGHWHWNLSRIEIASIELDAMQAEGHSLLPPAEKQIAPPVPEKAPPFWIHWLPDEVKISPARVRDFTIRWGRNERDGGILERCLLLATFHPDRIDLSGAGGRLRQPGAPMADLRTVEARLAEDRLFITRAELAVDSGRIEVAGEVAFESPTQLDLQLQFANLDLARFLEPDWQKKISGRIEGTADLVATVDQSVQVTGRAETRDMVITALPVLDELALFTTLRDFRRLAVHEAQSDFRWRPGNLELTNLHVEAEGLLLIKGGLAVEGEQLDGLVNVGLTARSLQWIPGARDKVFTDQSGIYQTTPVHIAGTRDRPKEDLTRRLAVGAATSTVEKAGEVATQAGKKANEVADDLQQLPAKTIDRLFDLLPQ